MADTPSKSGRFRDALRSRDLRIMFAAYLADGLGSWAYATVLIVYVFDRTGSTTWIALITGSRWLPGLLMASYGGVIADRYERTRVLIYSALLSYVVMIGIAVVVATDGPLALLLVLSATAAVMASPYRPAAGALTPEIVDERDLAAANGMFAALENLVVVLGPLLGALMLLADESSGAIVFNAISFLVAALLVMQLDIRSTGDASDEGESVLTAFIDGLSALRSNSIAFALVLFCALDSAIYGASTVLYVPISLQLGTGTDGYGYLLAGAALGGVVAAGLANRLSTSHRLAPIIIVGIAAQAAPYAVVSFVHRPALAFALMVVSGVGMILVDVLALTALQRSMPRGVLGRVLSLLDVAILGSILAASFVFALVVSHVELRSALFALGIGFPTVAVLAIGPLLRADRIAVARLRELEPKITLLHVLDLFAAANRPTIERLAGALEDVDVDTGVEIIREGDAADALYVIVSGEVSVSSGGAFIRTMGPRSYFGEIGLLRDIPRTATVRATEPCMLWRLSGDEFLDAIQNTEASVSLVNLATSRLARTHPRLVDAESQ